MARDYYGILGVEKSASDAEIKKAYRKTDDDKRVIETPSGKIVVYSDEGLPYGKYPRLIMAYVITRAVATMNGCSGYSTNSTSFPSGEVPENTRPEPSVICSR